MRPNARGQRAPFAVVTLAAFACSTPTADVPAAEGETGMLDPVALELDAGENSSVQLGANLAALRNTEDEAPPLLVASAVGAGEVRLHTVVGRELAASAILAPPEDGLVSFGRMLANAGDVDGDGREDLLVSATVEETGLGVVWVFTRPGEVSALASATRLSAPGQRGPHRQTGVIRWVRHHDLAAVFPDRAMP